MTDRYRAVVGLALSIGILAWLWFAWSDAPSSGVPIGAVGTAMQAPDPLEPEPVETITEERLGQPAREAALPLPEPDRVLAGSASRSEARVSLLAIFVDPLRERLTVPHAVVTLSAEDGEVQR